MRNRAGGLLIENGKLLLMHRIKNGDEEALEQYLNYEDCGFIVKRVLLFDNEIPVAFFDILDDDIQYNIAVGTRSDIKYRNKGYASNAAKQGMMFYNKYKKLFKKKVIWGVRTDNIASIKIAESLGFIKDCNSYSDDNKWINYVYE